MAQFQRKTHPARDRLELVSKRAKWLYEAIEESRAQDGPKWTPEVYFPLPALIEILPDEVARRRGIDTLRALAALGPLGMVQEIEPMLTMATWRMTQGIYRIDPAVYPHIIETPLEGELPAGVLMKLPEWCVFVETPGLKTVSPDGNEVDMLGAWSRQDYEPETHKRMLSIALLVHGDTLMPHQHLPLAGTIDQAINGAVSGWNDLPHANVADSILGYMRPIVNLLLYIASTTDFSRRGKAFAPTNPDPKRTRRDGWRLFAAPAPTEWDVGVRMGAALRAAYQREQTGEDAAPGGRQVRPHVRRAHWHTFLSGPRLRDGEIVPSADRRRDLRWVPPIPVNIDDVDSLPATIRQVR